MIFLAALAIAGNCALASPGIATADRFIPGVARDQTSQIGGEIRRIMFAGRDKGIVVESTTKVGESYEDRLYFSPFPKLAPRLIATNTNNCLTSPDGRYLAAETPKGLSVFHLPGGKLVASVYGEVGAFSPDSRRFAYMNGVAPRILDLGNRFDRLAFKAPAEFDRYAPVTGTLESRNIERWDRTGLVVRFSYRMPEAEDYTQITLCVDPVAGRVLQAVPRKPTQRQHLDDGSLVYDEASDEAAMTFTKTRIVRVAQGKKKVLFEASGISAGHEETAGLRVSPNGMTVVVYGANDPENPTGATIWSVDPKSGRRHVLASGRYRMPTWADGSSRRSTSRRMASGLSTTTFGTMGSFT